MKIYLGFFLSTVLNVTLTQGQIESIGLADYKDIVDEKSDRLKIVNFWATWCKPCLKELPAFSQLENEEEAEIILISIDAAQMIDKAAQTLQRFSYEGRAYLLTSSDEELAEIYTNWSGAAPLTLMYNTRNELVEVFEKEIDYKTLKRTINKQNYIK